MPNTMATFSDGTAWYILPTLLFMLLTINVAKGDDIFLEWHVAIDSTIEPISSNQPVISINGMFPGPLINSTTNDNIHVNVFNELDEPLLMTWNGIQQRLNSWQDGVTGTNCPIQPGTNWTYNFQMKDQIGTYFYFPSTNFQKAAGGFGPIRVNNRITVNVPFDKPEDEFDLLVGDWYEQSFEEVRSNLAHLPTWMLMNGKGPFNNSLSKAHESFTVSQGKTYRIRISNVGTTWSFNFRIQNHKMVLVELEGSYVDKITVDSLDVHVGQSYSVLVTADQAIADYYIVATPKMVDVTNQTNLVGVGVLHYVNSTTPPTGPLPQGPDPFDLEFSRSQAESIRWNLTTGAARPNPQGSFNISNLTLTQTFILDGLAAEINGVPRFTVNNVSYIAPNTSLKLADYYLNGSGVYSLDRYPVNRTLHVAVNGTFVATGYHKGVVEMVFVNNGRNKIESWHLDGFGFFVVGYGHGEWNPGFRNSTYNLYDPVYRSTVQVYPGGWTAVRAYLDNPGMWNLRSQLLKNWYLGQELYIRVYDPDNNEAKEFPPPANQLFCGLVQAPPMPSPVFPPPVSPPNPKPSDSPPHSSSAATMRIGWLVIIISILAIL